jgi:hypothetical protein
MLDAHKRKLSRESARGKAAVSKEQRRWHIGEQNAIALSRCGNVTLGARCARALHLRSA